MTSFSRIALRHRLSSRLHPRSYCPTQADARSTFRVSSHFKLKLIILLLAPHGKLAVLGVAGHAWSFSPATSLKVAQEAFGKVTDMSRARVVERKGGVIRTGGRLRHVYQDDELGCTLLLGDAAGLCGAAMGGGIYPALISGWLAAHAVASSLLDGERTAIPTYLRDIAYAGRLGDYLRIEDWLRCVLDR